MSYENEQQAMRIGQLMVKQLQGILNEDEERELITWLKLSDRNRQAYEDFMDDHIRQAFLQEGPPRTAEEVLPLLLARHQQRKSGTPGNQNTKPVRHLRKWLAYAAAILLVGTVTTWFFLNGPARDQQVKLIDAEKILPGGNKATLTLADGRTISLDQAKEGIIVRDNNILYSDESQEVVRVDTDMLEQLMLTTPKGGTYQLTLPDGSQVWLNAASTLKYPSRFDQDNRVVEVSGEAYFSIVADKSRPFRVMSPDQVIEVLGTAFNISAYPEENATRTTLVEGRVKVIADNEQGRLLKPGEQVISEAGEVRVEAVNVDQYIAWKDGVFYFRRLPLQAALMQLARWYDMEVVYEGKIPQVNVYGELDRKLPLGAVLKSLERSGLQFKVVQSGEVNQLVVLDKT